MKPYIKVATIQDAINLSKDLRKEDIEEIKAYANIKPKEALILGIQQSKIPLGIFNQKGEIVSLCGVRSINPYLGQVWLLASPKIQDNFSMTFLRHCRAVADVLVIVNGAVLVPTTDYTISGTNLTFATAPASDAEIQIRYLPIEG